MGEGIGHDGDLCGHGEACQFIAVLARGGERARGSPGVCFVDEAPREIAKREYSAVKSNGVRFRVGLHAVDHQMRRDRWPR